MSKAFGKHLQELRTEKTNYTRSQIAELIKVDLDTYQKYELVEIEPSMHRMYKLIEVLEIDLVTLLEYEEDNNIALAEK